QSVLVALVVIAALAVLVGVLLNTLGGDSDDSAGSGGTAASGEPRPGKPDASGEPDDGASPSASTGDGSADDKGEGKGEDAGEDAGKGGGKGDGDGQDSGTLDTTTFRSEQGYTIGLPSGWRYRSTDRAGDRFTGPGDQRLLVGWTSTPKDDAVADWKQLERTMTRPQYKRIRIEAVDFRGWEAADWEFTYVDGGTKYRTVDRGFVVSPTQGYALMYTAPAADWSGDRREDTWAALSTTFRPKS
ncbi:serine/threonine protein kinase, partial [Streptomyces sp. UH6]|nr:serine/threonine protein kinase [Streptomyces sp. UH6]